MQGARQLAGNVAGQARQLPAPARQVLSVAARTNPVTASAMAAQQVAQNIAPIVGPSQVAAPRPVAGPNPNNMGIVPGQGVSQLPLQPDYGDAPGPAHYKVPGKWWNEGAHIEGNGIPGDQRPVPMPMMRPPVVPGRFVEDSPGVPLRRWPTTELQLKRRRPGDLPISRV